ncbi:autotransporter domain-containing protein [Psychrobacter urativorans]|uniref:Autotransporter domain-containing protein n=1 Tax=Psychrobacter urativorans TaxID=45610 RepID=A0A0M4U4Z1_9GAMM|nr:autotransporter domain-containing protein [Psychrobacter urativorans]ALF59856.1 hypothetical protein AOC03_07225 [Psychrobacter urativorans]
MNHIYRIVFNRSLGVYQCVSEIAKTQGKSSGRSATTKRGAGFTLRALSVSMLSIFALGTTTAALATVYNNGLTTNLGVHYTVSAAGDEVKKVNTVVKADNLFISETSLLITNKGKVKIANTATMSKDANLEIKNKGMLTAQKLNVGGGGGINNNIKISTGGQLQASNIYLGESIGGEGNLTVTDIGSLLEAKERLVVGNDGKGSLTIADGGSVSVVDYNDELGGLVDVGSAKGSDGKLIITGAGSNLTTSYYDANYDVYRTYGILTIGNKGKGSATIADGGSAIVGDVHLGSEKGSEGSLTVTGVGSELDNNGIFIIGNEGKGNVTIKNGALARLTYPTLGLAKRGEGSLTVTGAGSQLDAFDDLIIGNKGKGSVTVADGGFIDAYESVYIGDATTGKGNLIVTGTNSKLIIDTFLGIGNEGKGSATIADGGLVQAVSINVGLLTGSEGNLLVTGAGSRLESNGYFTVGQEGKGSATIADGGLVSTRYVDNGQEINIGEYATGEGDLTVNGTNSQVIADNVFVGNEGKGTLNINDNGHVITGSISRGSDSKLSVINFDNGTLELSDAQSANQAADPSAGRPALFDNFTSANTINLASGGGTIDTNEFDISVFNDARITGSGNFTKMGSGKLAMNSATKAWSGDTDINQGTLQLNGDYNMRKGEVLAIGLNTLTDYGQLKVTGSADISQGKLQVNAADAVQVLTGNPVWNNVVSANTLTGKFAAVNDNSLLVSFLTDYSDANSVHLKMVRDATFVDAIKSQTNQTALNLASVLDLSITDRLDNNANALADALIVSTINFDQPKLAAAANELQPLLMGATNRLITDSNYATTEAIIERSLTNPNRGVWAKIIGSDSSHDEEDGIAGYDASSYGAIVGIDSPINDNLNLGVAFSYIDSDVDSNSRALDHEMKTKNWQILGYGNYAASEATQVNFHAGAGSSDVKGQRHITILTDATASSDYSVDTLQAGFGIGHRIGNELRNFTPFAQMNYARAESDGYRETGAGVYNLDVDENTYESLRWTAGVKMSQALTPKLALTGQLAAAIENGDRRSDITASFIGMPNANFTTTGQEIGREIGIVGVGLSYMPTANTKLSAGYRGEWRDNYNDQGASIALQTSF